MWLKIHPHREVNILIKSSAIIFLDYILPPVQASLLSFKTDSQSVIAPIQLLAWCAIANHPPECRVKAETMALCSSILLLTTTFNAHISNPCKLSKEFNDPRRFQGFEKSVDWRFVVHHTRIQVRCVLNFSDRGSVPSNLPKVEGDSPRFPVVGAIM